MSYKDTYNLKDWKTPSTENEIPRSDAINDIGKVVQMQRIKSAMGIPHSHPLTIFYFSLCGVLLERHMLNLIYSAITMIYSTDHINIKRKHK